MNKQDKELLLKDLCARLPYGIIASVRGSDEEFQHFHILGVKYGKVLVENDILQVNNFEDVEVVKPYLRPMSSMTEEEIRIEREIQQDCFFGRKPLIILTDFYYSRNLDVNGLIEKGLALPAPEGMYNF